MLNAKIKEKGLVDKSDNSGFIDHSDLDQKIATLATKAELKSKQDKLAKRQSFDSSYFRDKINFEDYGTQNDMVFQSGSLYFPVPGPLLYPRP